MSELKALLKLALPIIISQVGFVSMGFVDTLVIGPLGPEALAAMSLGNTFFFGILIFGLGTLMALDTWISQAYGAGNLEDCSVGFVQGIWLALTLFPFLLMAMFAVPYVLEVCGYDPAMIELMESYLGPLRWGLLPALLFKSYRCALTSINITRPLVLAAVLANLANWGLDLWLVDGGFGVPAFGVVGIAWSTTACRLVLLAPLFYTVHLSGRCARFPRPALGPSTAALRRLCVLGLPIGLQYGIEVGCFSGATVLMGLKGAIPLAAHQVALNFSSLIFMVPMGIGAAAAVRTGQAWGAGSADRAKHAGWTAIRCALCFGLLSAVVLALGREEIVRLYRVDDTIFTMAVDFLMIAAAFQLGDAVQAVSLGVLRGLGDTQVPFMIVLAGYGLAAAPIGILGTFYLTDDPRWIWYGLATGLVVVAVTLSLRFVWLLRATEPPHDSP